MICKPACVFLNSSSAHSKSISSRVQPLAKSARKIINKLYQADDMAAEKLGSGPQLVDLLSLTKIQDRIVKIDPPRQNQI